MKTVISSYEDAVSNAAAQVKRIIQQKPDAVLALSAGRSTRDLYSRLAKMFKNKEISFSHVTMFEVTEYVGIPPDDPRSSLNILDSELLSLTDFKKENCRFISDYTPADYDAEIAAAGGIDLAVLGIGVNAHIGFNAPATEFDSYTHVQKLTDPTRRQYARIFGGEEKVPTHGVTMGIKTLCSAENVVVLAFGDEKADAVFKMLYGRNDSTVPAAFLQLPANVTVYLDGDAASKLKNLQEILDNG